MAEVGFIALWLVVMLGSWWILLGRSMWRDWLRDDLRRLLGGRR